MMSQKPYPVYKDSGVKWLGKVPSHWEIRRLKHVIDFKEGPGIMAKDFREDGVPLLRIGNVQADEAELEGCNYLDEKQVGLQWDHFRVKKDDLLISCSASTGIVSRITEQTAGAIPYTGLIRLRPASGNIERDFIRWLVSSDLFFVQIELLKTGSTIQHYGPTHLSQMFVTVAPLAEQQAIGRFLDHKTSEIDTLIAAKERLITLLQEKRAALITHAVTKGLDPSVPMKDSGIEWLGRVLAHWEIKRIKYLLDRIIDTEHKTAPFHEDGEFLVARTSNIRNGLLDLSNAKYTDRQGYEEWTKRGIPEPGDIIFTREAPAGEACIVPSSPTLCLGQRTVLFKVDQEKLHSPFGVYALYGGLSDEFVDLLSQGSTVAHFNMGDIGNIPIIWAPLDEQIEIANYLDKESAHIDDLVAKVQDGIERLQEYRTALISSAVTGKIDVRDY